MGRKKKKSDTNQEDVTESENTREPVASAATSSKVPVPKDENPTAKSGYMMTSHSGEIIQEDIYVSDGSEDSDDPDSIEIVLIGSRMGLMRRGLHHLSALQQPNRQWVRQTATESSVQESNQPENVPIELTEEEKRRQEEEELAKLDPAQRAARLLIEKQRKIEEAKEEARQKENEENAVRDPTLFSKRTAFDIRFDQIDDKPWTRGSGDVSDFFNYGMNEDDWIEYARQQIILRQELIDAARQKRPPDPAIVPVQIRRSVVVADQALVNNTTSSGGATVTVESDVAHQIKDANLTDSAPIEDEDDSDPDPYIDIDGGAWGAAPPEFLLEKLIKEENQNENETTNNELTTETTDMQQKPANSHDGYSDHTTESDSASDHESVESSGTHDQDRYVDKKTDYHSTTTASTEKRFKHENVEDPRDDGSHSVSSIGRTYRKRTHNNSQREDYYYGPPRHGWQQGSTVPPSGVQAARSYYSQPASHTFPIPPPVHQPYAHSPVGESFRGRGGGPGRSGFSGGRFSSGRGRGGRSFPDGGRGGRGDYNKSGWKQNTDTRWRR